MLKDHGQIISQIRNEFETVKIAYQRLKEEKDELVKHKQALLDKVEKQNIVIKELETRNENIILAKVVSGSIPEDESLADRRIDNLIAEIDKCIALLNR